MKPIANPFALRRLFVLFILLSLYSTAGMAQVREYRGLVTDTSGDPLISALLSVDGTNISTITNSEGEFLLKTPSQIDADSITVSHLGYLSRTLPLSYFSQNNVVIELQESMEELSEVSILSYTDPEAVVRNMLKNRGANYLEEPTKMTAFYRETIKRGRKNVSLSEAVINIYKTSYQSVGKDNISVIKARKTADYDRLDTVALKLRGGPYNPLSIDLMKNPTYIFGQEELDNFHFSFDNPTRINNRYLYVINFEELSQGLPWYYGKLFIDAESFTLVKASFNLNVDNRSASSDLFVKKKPGGTKVYPVEVHYDILYHERDGKWYYGYGKNELEFVVNWKRRLFNSRYKVHSELAVTDWNLQTDRKIQKDDSFINERVIMADDVTGFADIGFWGENNIIEPDKSIENAIDKIRKNLEKN